MKYEANYYIDNIAVTPNGEIKALSINGEDVFNELGGNFKKLTMNPAVGPDGDTKTKVTFNLNATKCRIFYSFTEPATVIMTSFVYNVDSYSFIKGDKTKIYLLAVKEGYTPCSMEVSLE